MLQAFSCSSAPCSPGAPDSLDPPAPAPPVAPHSEYPGNLGTRIPKEAWLALRGTRKAAGILWTWVWLKIKQEGLRRCWSMFPLTRVPFWTFFLSHSHMGRNQLVFVVDSTRVFGMLALDVGLNHVFAFHVYRFTSPIFNVTPSNGKLDRSRESRVTSSRRRRRLSSSCLFSSISLRPVRLDRQTGGNKKDTQSTERVAFLFSGGKLQEPSSNQNERKQEETKTTKSNHRLLYSHLIILRLGAARLSAIPK